jgi:hypothetical protein
MELLAICVVLVTCVILTVMVIGMAVADRRRARVRAELDERLAPYDRVIDLRDDRTGGERYLDERLKDPEYAAAYKAASTRD